MKDWRNIVISIMVTAIVAGVTAWLTLGRTAVTRAEMMETIEPFANANSTISMDIRALSNEVAQLRTAQALTAQKVDNLVEQIKELKHP